MAGISASALKGVNYPENRKKYNGIEFTEDLDLDIYDAQLRNLDPQIGRWSQIDPKIENMEMWSPYASNYDNPIRFNDFLGDEPGGPNDPIVKVGLVTGRTYNLTKPTDVKSSLKFAGQYAVNTLNEFVAGVNQNLNPVYSAVNGAQALATGKDIQTGKPVNSGEAAVGVLSAIPMGKAFQMLGKLAGMAEGALARGAEQTVVKAAASAGDNVAENAAGKGGTELFNFSKAAAKHMENPGRAVPVQILEQTIKGSTGVADSEGSRALMHTMEMWKNGKAYNLEVLYDKATNSIWHFQYNPVKPK